MREFPNRENIFGLERTGVEVNEGMEAWFEITRQLPGAVPAETLSIVDGGIAPLSAELLVDTEGEAPADDLEYIVLDGTHAGMCLYLKAASPDRLVRVVHNPNAESGVILSGGSRALSHLTSLCLKRVGNHWEEWSAANIQGAGPEQAGLVPSGGGAGQFFGVSDDGLSYEFKSVDLSAFTEQLGQHGERHDAHGAVAEAEAGRIIVRDAEGRAQVSAPEAAQDIANKGYVDALAFLSPLLIR